MVQAAGASPDSPRRQDQENPEQRPGMQQSGAARAARAAEALQSQGGSRDKENTPEKEKPKPKAEGEPQRKKRRPLLSLDTVAQEIQREAEQRPSEALIKRISNPTVMAESCANFDEALHHQLLGILAEPWEEVDGESVSLRIKGRSESSSGQVPATIRLEAPIEWDRRASREATSSLPAKGIANFNGTEEVPVFLKIIHPGTLLFNDATGGNPEMLGDYAMSLLKAHNIQRHADSPYVMSSYGAFFLDHEPPAFVQVLPLKVDHPLNNDPEDLDTEELMELATKVLLEGLLGMNALHEKGYFHKDIKPTNIMLDEETSQTCLGDLGSSSQSRDIGGVTTAFLKDHDHFDKSFDLYSLVLSVCLMTLFKGRHEEVLLQAPRFKQTDGRSQVIAQRLQEVIEEDDEVEAHPLMRIFREVLVDKSVGDDEHYEGYIQRVMTDLMACLPDELRPQLPSGEAAPGTADATTQAQPPEEGEG